MSVNDRRNGVLDDQLVLALAGGATYAEAARAAGCSERTARRHAALPDFAQRVTEVRAAVYQRTADQLAEATTTAVTTLQQLLTDESAQVRCRAALGLLSAAPHWREATELSQRLADIEASHALLQQQLQHGHLRSVT